MRKFYSFVLILTAALCSFSNSAWGETLTVASDATGCYSAQVPVYPTYTDETGTKSQIIYSKDLLTALAGSNIMALRYYTNKNITWGSAGTVPTLAVRMKEVDLTTLSGFQTGLTQVYSGQPTGKGTTEMYIAFSSSFTYSGTKNLLIEVEVTTGGGYQSDLTFYNKSMGSGNIGYWHYHYSDSPTPAMPKTTFTYESAAPVSCPKPTGFAYDNLTSSSVDISWTAGGEEEEWNIQYKAADDADWTTVEGITDNPYTLDVLEPLTSYQVKVQAVCDVDDLSSFTSALSFTTPCAEEELPFYESFNCLASGIPECWDNSEGTTTTDSYKWNYFATGRSGACVRFNSFNNSSGLTNMLRTPAIKIHEATTLSFYYKNPTGGDFSVYYSINGGAQTLLASGLTGKSSWTKVSYSIPAQATEKNVVFIFKGTSNWGNGDAYIYLDDISLSRSSCTGQPTGLTASDVDANSAQLSWTSSASQWGLRYRVSCGDWTTMDNITTKPYTLAGLEPITEYEVQVKTVCGAGDESAWSESATFRTACGAISSLPWTFGFEGVSTSPAAIPECWTRTPDNTSIGAVASYLHTGSRSMKLSGGYTARTIILPEFAAPFNVLKIEFYHKIDYANDAYGKLKIGYVNTSGTFVALKTITPSTTYTKAEYTYPSSYASTPAKIAIQFSGAESSSYDNRTLYIDDITVSSVLDCSQPEDVTASAETNNTAHIAWTARAGITTYQYCVVARDADPDWSGNLTTATNSVDLSALSASTDYDFYVRCVCGVGEYSDVSDVCQFSTTAGCPTPSGVSFSNRTHNSATVTWTAGGSEAAWNLRYKAGSGEWTTPVRLTSRTYNLTGLTTGTTYTVEVQADCGGTWVSNTYTPTCPSLGEISKSAMTACGVTLSWSAGGSETGWNVHYKAGAGAYGDPIHVTSPTYTLTGLTTGTTYYYQVQADCGGDWTTVGSYTPVCPVPGMPTFSNQTYNSVRVSWTAGNCEDSWNLRYKKGEDEWTVVSDLTSRTYDATGLVAGNEYTFQVQAGCEGTWSASSTYTPECPQPGDITLTNQKYDRVTVGWAKGGTEDAWRLRYRAADGDWIVKEANTTSNSGHVIDGLTSGVTYTIEVTASCCAGGSARTTTYTPSCAQPGAITLSNRTHSSVQVAWAASGTLDRWNLQYKEASAEDVPANWTNVVMNTASLSGHTISGLTTDVTYTIRVTAACCSAAPQDIEYTPVCATPASASVTNVRDVQASASWSAVSGSGITTFQYIVVARDATPDWSEATTVSATSATLTGLSVATYYDFYVRSKCADGNYSESLKRQFATAAQMPTSIVVDELDYDGLGATLSWSKSTNGAETQYQWKTSKAGSEWSEPTTVRTVHVTGLSEHTTYTFYVRSYYNETVQSFAVTRSFTTDYGLNAVPWSHDFESDATGSGQIPAGWNSKTYGSYTVYPYVVANGYSTYSYAGTKCLYFSGGASSSQQSIILPKFNRDLKDLTISFYYNNGTTDTDYPTFEIGYYATDGNPSTAFTAIAAIPLSDGYTLAEINLQDFPTTHRRLVISYSNGTYYTHSAYIDDINVFETPNCQRPVSPTCRATTSSSATLAWTENGAATTWEIEYSIHSDFSSPSTIVAAATNPFTISDLNQNTQYYARVRGVCDEEDKSEWSTTSASFRTACGGSYASDDMPFRFDFESDTEVGSDGRIPYCWSSIAYTQNASNIYPHVSSTGGRTAAQCLCFFGGTSTSTQYITLPDMEDNLMSLTIEFYYKNYSTNTDYGQFTVGYLTTPGDASTFVAVQALDRVNNTYTKASVDLKSVPASVHAITIRYGGATSTLTYDYIDDIVVYPTAKIFTDGGGDGLWSNTANWMMGVLPTAEDSVIVRKPVAVDIATAKAKAVILDQRGTKTGSLTVQPNKGLEVVGTIKVKGDEGLTTTTPADLMLESSEAGNASLIFDNSTTENQATVALYSKAVIVDEDTWNWQYIATPLTDGNALYNYYGSYLYKWGTDGWEVVPNGAAMVPFAGYCITQESATTHVMDGTLVPTTSQEIAVGTDADVVIGNSWTAPIYIGGFTAETFTSTPATIYLFNTGMAEEGSSEGTEPGTYTTVPVNSAPYTGNELIAPMQGFFVTSYGGAAGTITMNYAALVRPAGGRGIVAGEMHAPRRIVADEEDPEQIIEPSAEPEPVEETPEPDVMKIIAHGSQYTDRVILLAREDFSRGFDNGWDGDKLSMGEVSPSIYVVSPYGTNEAVSAIPDFEGTVVGFHAGADALYTLTFEYEGNDVLYFNDLTEQTSTYIGTGYSYTFIVSDSEKNTQDVTECPVRFIISRTPLNYMDGVTTGVDNSKSVITSQKLLIDGILYVIRNGRVYSTEGTLLK